MLFDSFASDGRINVNQFFEVFSLINKDAEEGTHTNSLAPHSSLYDKKLINIKEAIHQAFKF